MGNIKGGDNGYLADVGSDKRLLVDSKITSSPEDFYKGSFITKHLILDGSEPYTFTKGSMNIDGSSVLKNFYRIPPSNKKWYICGLKIIIEDSSINHTKFGGISELTNGILLKVTENGSERDLYEHSFKKNGSFYHLSTRVDIDSSTTDILSVEFSLLKSGTALCLKNSTSDNIKLVIQDNLTSIDFMECVIFGYEVDE